MKDTLIAVVGVSHDPTKYGHRIFKNLVEAKYKVVGINPKGGQVAGRDLYTSLDMLPEVPDMVMTIVPPQVTEQVVAKCKHLGISKIWMQPGSESETVVKKAKDAGIDVTTNACFMVQEHIWKQKGE